MYKSVCMKISEVRGETGFGVRERMKSYIARMSLMVSDLVGPFVT